MSTVARPAGLITREGHERLRAELDQLVRQREPQLAAALREARAGGAESGEDKGVAQTFEEHAAVQRRIEDLRALLAAVQIAEPPADGTVGIGQRVRIRLGPGAAPRTFRLVGALEADGSPGEISVESPIGQALVGRRSGDVVDVQTPGGPRRVELVDVG